MKDLRVQTDKQRQVIDITEHIAERIGGSSGLCHVFVAHTTCSLTIADMDPGMESNITEAFWEMIPKIDFRHHDPEHTPSHLLSSLIGVSTTFPVADGVPLLGTWQRIVLVEFDGPKERQIKLNLIDTKE